MKKIQEKTIYTLMNEVYTLRHYVELALKAYKAKESYYMRIENEAFVSLLTVIELKKLYNNEYGNVYEQLRHVFAMYKRRIFKMRKRNIETDIPFDPPYTNID